MPASYTPLRYPGGKSRLANFVKLILLKNDLKPVHYIEPYAGGSGLGITLLLHGFASSITINDIDPLVYSFWVSAVYDTDTLCKRIASTRVSMTEWYRQREIIEDHKRHSTIKLGFAAFYLNRTNRSGIIRGGVIGGKEQTGKWKINARYNKKALIERIQNIASLRDKIRICNMDACDLLNKPSLRHKDSLFWYLDPPYFVKGQELYENYYSANDHKQVVECIADRNEPWVVSYDDVPEIRNLFRRYKRIRYGINYSAADRYGGREVVFFSPDLKVPRVTTPLEISPSLIKKHMRMD